VQRDMSEQKIYVWSYSESSCAACPPEIGKFLVVIASSEEEAREIAHINEIEDRDGEHPYRFLDNKTPEIYDIKKQVIECEWYT